MKLGFTYLNSFFLPAILILILILFAAANLFLVPAVQYAVFSSPLKQKSLPDSVVVSEKELVQLREKADLLQKKMNRLASPGKTYLIINTTENKFRLYNGNQQLRSGLCSTGSFIHLEADSTKNWIFETPKGVLTVRNKIPHPVWRKPDWAFIEEGLEPPPLNHPSRYEYGVLGDYALDLGNGYLIHGTLYQRFLGQSVTHGCIRLNDEDLASVYQTLVPGSKVYIY
jgi:hypothetical protein